MGLTANNEDDFMKKFMADFTAKNSNDINASQSAKSQGVSIDSQEQKKEISTLSDVGISADIQMDSHAQQDEENRNRRMADIDERKKHDSPVDITERISRLAKDRAKARKEHETTRQNGTAPKRPLRNPAPVSRVIKIKKKKSEVFVPTKHSDISKYRKGKDFPINRTEAGSAKSDDRSFQSMTKRFNKRNTLEISGFGKSFNLRNSKYKVGGDRSDAPGSHLFRKSKGNSFNLDKDLRRVANQNEVTSEAYKVYRGTKIAYQKTRSVLKSSAKTAASITNGMIKTGAAASKTGKAAGGFARNSSKTMKDIKGRVENFKNRVNDSDDRIKKVQDDMKKAVDRLKKMTARKRAEDLKKGNVEADGSIRKAAKERSEQFVRVILLGLIKKVLVALTGVLLSAVLFLAPVLLVLLAIFSLLSKDLPVYDCMEDYVAYLKIAAACEEYGNRWKEAVEEEMVERFTLPQPEDCPYGNYNTVETEYTCGSEHEEDAVKGLVIDPEDIYSLICAYYDGEIHNLSAAIGSEEYDPESPEEEEIMGLIQLILETYYPYDYIDSVRFEIQQDIYLCHHNMTEEEIAEGRERTEYVESREKPLLYFSGDNAEYADEDPHVFLKTFVTYRLEPFTYVLDLMADKEVLDRYRIYRSCFQSYFIPSSDNLEDVPQEFLDSIHYFSGYDNLSLDEFLEDSASWPCLQLTRDEFAEAVKTHCNGSIPYSWGGSSFSGSDCSGFVCLMFRNAGYELDGNTAWLWENSYAIDSTDAMPGDLVFKQAPAANGINHMGILYDNSDEEACLFMHCASGSGSVINDYGGFVMYRRLPMWFLDDFPSSEDNIN